jgi:hypothetical protein
VQHRCQPSRRFRQLGAERLDWMRDTTQRERGLRTVMELDPRPRRIVRNHMTGGSNTCVSSDRLRTSGLATRPAGLSSQA